MALGHNLSATPQRPIPYTSGLSKKLSKSCEQVVKKLLKNCLEVVKKLSTSCQKVVKKLSTSCQNVVRKLSKSCQKAVKILTNCKMSQKKSPTPCRGLGENPLHHTIQKNVPYTLVQACVTEIQTHTTNTKTTDTHSTTNRNKHERHETIKQRVETATPDKLRGGSPGPPPHPPWVRLRPGPHSYGLGRTAKGWAIAAQPSL